MLTVENSGSFEEIHSYMLPFPGAWRLNPQAEWREATALVPGRWGRFVSNRPDFVSVHLSPWRWVKIKLGFQNLWKNWPSASQQAWYRCWTLLLLFRESKCTSACLMARWGKSLIAPEVWTRPCREGGVIPPGQKDLKTARRNQQ